MDVNQAGFMVRAHFEEGDQIKWIQFNKITRILSVHEQGVGTIEYKGLKLEDFEELATLSGENQKKYYDSFIRKSFPSKKVSPCVPSEQCCTIYWDRIPRLPGFVPEIEWRKPPRRIGGCM